ncbi:MAG: OmpA family protein [Acidobacteria bacterium]|nr:OmpA family protein [Acidobacteriota bacterium]
MARVGYRNRRRVDYDSLWLITFADLMVQLMAFFALAYSVSATDTQRFHAILRSLRKELGVATAHDLSPKGDQGILPGSLGLDPSRAADLERLLSERPSTPGPDIGTRMRMVSFRPSVLFEEGSPVIPPGSALLLDRLAGLTRDYPGFQLVCEGHAAPGERGRGGQDALELSGLRAQAAVRFLAASGIEAKILAAEAHGDSLPEGQWSAPEGRALQRRVSFRFQRLAER